MSERSRNFIQAVLSVLLCGFVLLEVNYPHLSPQSQLALFALLGTVLCFLAHPVYVYAKPWVFSQVLDYILIASTVLCCGYVVIQTEPLFRSLWLGAQSLGNRAGQEYQLDFVVGAVGVLLILEATRRAIGWTLPLLSCAFLSYAYYGVRLPDWLLPHRGYDVDRIVSQTFLHSQGVFGVALKVMFTYVFLFVLFGVLLELTGATRFIIDFARRVSGRTSGGPAKVSVLSSGLMGSLSGSAVANTATTGTFTIPMMRSAGFEPHIAGGVEAAASSGGALAPPVMGAAAYMMLEIVEPPVTYLEIIRAALLPAILYYLSLLLIVHFYARRAGSGRADGREPPGKLIQFEGLIFAGALVALVTFLVLGFTPFRAVSLSIVAIFVLGAFKSRTRLTFSRLLRGCVKAAESAIPLVCAAGCVGLVIGVVTLTGVGTKLPALILPLARQDLLLALVLLMVSSIVLGMGLPSAICYLLLATFIGPALSQLGVVPLAAHLFIFYFGMMSMVTPPVALAAYCAATIAGSSIMKTAFAAFRFALVGFTLPYMFVFRPQLLMLDAAGRKLSFFQAIPSVLVAILGIVPLAAAISGFLFARLALLTRLLLLLAAGVLLVPTKAPWFPTWGLSGVDLAAMALLAVLFVQNWRLAKDRR